MDIKQLNEELRKLEQQAGKESSDALLNSGIQNGRF